MVVSSVPGLSLRSLLLFGKDLGVDKSIYHLLVSKKARPFETTMKGKKIPHPLLSTMGGMPVSQPYPGPNTMIQISTGVWGSENHFISV